MFQKAYKLLVPSSDEKKVCVAVRIEGFERPAHFTISANSLRILILDVIEDQVVVIQDVRMKGAEELPRGIGEILRLQAEKNLCKEAA